MKRDDARMKDEGVQVDLWPRALTWSDESCVRVEAWLPTASSASDSEFPEELRDDAAHICTGCIGDGPCEAEPEEPSVSAADDDNSDGDDWPDADPDAAGSHGGLRIYDGEGSKS